MKVEKYKGVYFKGAVYPRKSGKSFRVVYPLGWNDSKKKYDEYYEEVATVDDAKSVLKDIDDFLYHGGSVYDIPLHRGKAKPEPPAKRMTVKEYIDEYCSLRADQKVVARRTVSTDRECLNRVVPYIGGLALDSVTPSAIDSMYAQMRSDGRKNLNGKPYSGTTVEKTHAALSLMFKKAIQHKCITENPCDAATKPERDTDEKRALTPAQAQALFAFISSEPLTAKGVGVLLALGCGLRLSEMLALSWCDFENGYLHVRRSMEKNTQKLKSTKNGEERDVPCPPPLLPVLNEWQVTQKDWYKEHGLKWSEKVPIVQSRAANRILQRSYQKWWAKERVRYPIPDDFEFHGLRHTYVTLVNRDCGIDSRTTRALSGHKSDQAFQGYTHTNETWKREAASRLGAIMAPDSESRICQNCRHWTVSPWDLTRGACWARESDQGIEITEAIAPCITESFLIKAQERNLPHMQAPA